MKGQAAPTPERINEIQEALAKKGVFSGTPTGQWDDSTVEAMKKFQSSNRLNPSGKLDALTLQKLGLGSESRGTGGADTAAEFVEPFAEYVVDAGGDNEQPVGW